MQNIDTIVTGLAEDLARQSGANDPAIERLNAFRGGLQLGLSIRDWRASCSRKILKPEERSRTLRATALEALACLEAQARTIEAEIVLASEEAAARRWPKAVFPPIRPIGTTRPGDVISWKRAGCTTWSAAL